MTCVRARRDSRRRRRGDGVALTLMDDRRAHPQAVRVEVRGEDARRVRLEAQRPPPVVEGVVRRRRAEARGEGVEPRERHPGL